MRIYRRQIRLGHRCFVIAEAGSNHAGHRQHAHQLVAAAAHAGAHAIKFQLFRWADISHVAENRPKELELPTQWLPKLRDHAHDLGLAFLCTPFAPWAVDALDGIVDAWKIGSFESGYQDLVDEVYHNRIGPVILSLGMASAHQRKRLLKRYRKAAMLHCVSQYPTPMSRANLAALKTLLRSRDQAAGPVGYSSHTDGYVDCTIAAGLGASIIEKHIRLSTQIPTPDSGRHSLSPLHFEQMVDDIHLAQEVSRSRGVQPSDAPYGRKLNGA